MDIYSPLLVSFVTANFNKILYYDKFQALKPNAITYRKRFFQKSQREAYNNGGNEKVTEINALIKREYTKEMWRAINLRAISKQDK